MIQLLMSKFQHRFYVLVTSKKEYFCLLRIYTVIGTVSLLSQTAVMIKSQLASTIVYQFYFILEKEGNPSLHDQPVHQFLQARCRHVDVNVQPQVLHKASSACHLPQALQALILCMKKALVLWDTLNNIGHVQPIQNLYIC